MFNDTSAYKLYREIIGGLTYYFVSFMDDRGEIQKVSVSRQSFLEFHRFVKRERNLQRWDERHKERLYLSDESLYQRAVADSQSLEEILDNKNVVEELHEAIDELPKIQRSRLLRYYFGEKTYAQIAEEEGCSFQAIAKSIKSAEKKIKKYFLQKG